VLIVDDFAMREFTPTQADDPYELLVRAARPPRQVADPDLQPLPGRLVPAVPKAVVGSRLGGTG
jgi:hypothetical protein